MASFRLVNRNLGLMQKKRECFLPRLWRSRQQTPTKLR